MKRITSLAVASMFVALVGCGDNAEPDPAMGSGSGSGSGSGTVTPTAMPFPSSCMDAGDGQAPADGEYKLYVGNDEKKPWTAYCYQGDEFLTVNDYTNFGELAVGGWANGSSTGVRTTYTKLRIDPQTLTIDVSDQTFARTDGGPLNILTDYVTSMPLGVAMSCADTATYGSANIDLTGTPFKIATTFTLASTVLTPGGTAYTSPAPHGGSSSSRDGQWLEMWAQGECGFIGPDGAGANPINKLPKGYVLKVEWFVPTP